MTYFFIEMYLVLAGTWEVIDCLKASSEKSALAHHVNMRYVYGLKIPMMLRATQAQVPA